MASTVSVSESKEATVKLRIENRYEFYPMVVTEPTTVVPLPLPADGTDERQVWDYDYIFSETGAGHSDGDSWYDVEIVESSVPALLGMKFKFGKFGYESSRGGA